MRAKTSTKMRSSDHDHESEFELNNKLLFRVFQTANLLVNTSTKWVADLEVTAQQWSVIGALSRPNIDEGMTVNQLSEYLMVSRQNLTGVLDRLDERGLTGRVPDRNDGRTKRVQLTPLGRRLLTKIVPSMGKFYDFALEGFTREERVAFTSMMDRLKANLMRKRS